MKQMFDKDAFRTSGNPWHDSGPDILILNYVFIQLPHGTFKRSVVLIT